jgi:hypothetical protein
MPCHCGPALSWILPRVGLGGRWHFDGKGA